MESRDQREPLWWQRGVIYQVYPRSFQDSNGDGIGDLAGANRRLDYLTWLGVHAIQLSPFYQSPMADFGYDVSDHCDVDPIFGTLPHVGAGAVVLGTTMSRSGQVDLADAELGPNEGIVVRLEGTIAAR